jgi:hypothetical protein
MTCENTVCQCCDDVPILEDDIRRRDELIASLRAQVAELKGPDYDFGACVRQVLEIDRLRARVAVLEAALRALAEDDNTGKPCWCVHDGWAQHSVGCDMARAALSQPAATGEQP